VTVELLYFDGCPSYERFLPRLRAVLAAAGIGGEVRLRRVESPEAAIAERFLGSPTVRVDGVDVGTRGRHPLRLWTQVPAVQHDGLHGTPRAELVVDALTATQGEGDGDGGHAP
jgi:hypothetical protein